MASDPLRRRSEPKEKPRPKIWAEGDQRPPFNLRAFGSASLHLSREGVAPLLAWAARTARRVAVNVKNGAGRIPEEKLGRAARFVPSHLRVAAWIKNGAAILSHASATADPDVKRGNALVAEIEPHLWTGKATPLPPPLCRTRFHPHLPTRNPWCWPSRCSPTMIRCPRSAVIWRVGLLPEQHQQRLCPRRRGLRRPGPFRCQAMPLAG